MPDEQWLRQQGFDFYVSAEPDKGRVYYVAYYRGQLIDIVEAHSLGNMNELFKECEKFLNGLSRVE